LCLQKLSWSALCGFLALSAQPLARDPFLFVAFPKPFPLPTTMAASPPAAQTPGRARAAASSWAHHRDRGGGSIGGRDVSVSTSPRPPNGKHLAASSSRVLAANPLRHSVERASISRVVLGKEKKKTEARAGARERLPYGEGLGGRGPGGGRRHLAPARCASPARVTRVPERM
jgi:hypothetical protein